MSWNLSLQLNNLYAAVKALQATAVSNPVAANFQINATPAVTTFGILDCASIRANRTSTTLILANYAGTTTLTLNANNTCTFAKDITVNGITVGLGNNATVTSNTAVGLNALFSTGASSQHLTALGIGALQSASTTAFTTGLGSGAFSNLTGGSVNIGIGYNSGAGLTGGSLNTYIGTTTAGSASAQYETVISNGSGAVGGNTGKGNNTTLISGTTAFLPATIVQNNGTTLTLGDGTTTGVSVGTLNATSVVSSGAISGTTITGTGAISGTSVVSSGAISGTTITGTGAISGTTITGTGAISGTTITGSSTITGASFTGATTTTIGSTSTQGMSFLNASGNAINFYTSGYNIFQMGTLNCAVQHALNYGVGIDFITFYYNGNAIGSVHQDSGTSITINYSSDYRLKENIQPINDCLTVLNKLKPISFNWKDGGKHRLGFLAHEFAEVFPNSVVGEKDAVDADGKIKSQQMSDACCIPLLVSCVQKQQDEITDLKAQLASLKAVVDALVAQKDLLVV